MPKMKTKRAAAKRLRKTAGGHLKRNRGWKRHLLEAKAPGRRRRLRKPALIAPANERRMNQLVPYL